MNFGQNRYDGLHHKDGYMETYIRFQKPIFGLKDHKIDISNEKSKWIMISKRTGL